MAKNPLITDEVKRVIAKIYLKHPDWRAKEIRDGVEAQLHEQNPRSKPGWPGLSAVQKELTKQRKTDEARPPESKRLDEPWSLSSLTKCSIPPEAMPIVMSVYKKRLAEKDPLLIREALWIARLYNIVDPPDLVWDWAFLYALEEMVSEDLGKPFDSRELDMEMITDVYSARETQREIAIWEIAEKYGSDPVKLKDLNLSIEETEEIAKSGKYKKEDNHAGTYS